MRNLATLAVLIGPALASCKPASVVNDPIRAEFVEACEGRIEYRSMKADRRTAYCECGYDRTMVQLTDEEKQVARFYLLTQVGVDVSSRNFVNRSNMNGIGKASKAIGNAGKQCG